MADEDRLQALLTGRMTPPSGGPNARIGAQPEPSKGRKLLETLTGYPADPMRDMEPMDGIQMLLSGLGAAKGLGMWGRTLMGGKSAKVGEIADDLYGMNPKQTRRQFFDRMTGQPDKRIMKDANALQDVMQDEIIFDSLAGPGESMLDMKTEKGWKALRKRNDLVSYMMEKSEPFNVFNPDTGELRTVVEPALRNAPMQEIIRATGQTLMPIEQVPAIPAQDLLHAYLRRFIK